MRDSEVAVVGVNHEAIEEAQFLTKFASTVHWITANDIKEDDTDAQDLLACENVRHWKRTKMLTIEGDEKGAGVTSIKVQSCLRRLGQSMCSREVAYINVKFFLTRLVDLQYTNIRTHTRVYTHTHTFTLTPIMHQGTNQ